MTIPKLKSLLGIAQRAGFVTSGSDSLLREVAKARGKKAKWLILVAEDAVTGTGEAIIRTCLGAGHSVLRVPIPMSELGLAIGKNRRGYVMIKDSGIAGRILALLEEMEVLPLDQSKDL